MLVGRNEDVTKIIGDIITQKTKINVLIKQKNIVRPLFGILNLVFYFTELLKQST